MPSASKATTARAGGGGERGTGRDADDDLLIVESEPDRQDRGQRLDRERDATCAGAGQQAQALAPVEDLQTRRVHLAATSLRRRAGRR